MLEAVSRRTVRFALPAANSARKPTERFISISRPAGQIGRAERNSAPVGIATLFVIEREGISRVLKVSGN